MAQWSERGYEKGETHSFWLSFLRDVLGVSEPEKFISFEVPVKLKHTSFIDAFLPDTKVIIEQKSLSESLTQEKLQSDGSTLTPYEQAQRYGSSLPYSMRPRWIVVCNFAEFLIYDMETLSKPTKILLSELPEKFHAFDFLIDETKNKLRVELELSLKAGEIVGKLYDALHSQYVNPNNENSLASLNKLCVRLVFCLYAESAGIFGKHKIFRDYLILLAFQEKLAAVKIFDPACGSGNFLTESYLSLRRLENEILKELFGSQIQLGEFVNPVKVSIGQFYGIEINDFAVAVAQTALWIAELQMIQETQEIIHHDLDFLPLKSYSNIHEGNALQLDWQNICSEPNYIIGNPPFVGARIMDSAQKADINTVFDGWKNAGNLDYVSAWYKKAADFARSKNFRAAFVSTNSICQGDSVGTLWKPLFNDIHIDFAHRTFRWDSESAQKAHVHCVIVGFSSAPNPKPKIIFDEDFVPAIGIGNKPIDDGNYLFTFDEMKEFIAREPLSEKYFRKWYGAREFINNEPRYCLLLKDCPPHELKRMPLVYQRVKNVRDFRLASKSAGTRKLADKPTRFHVENFPTGNYLLIPSVSSENRQYIPIGFMNPDELASNLVLVVPNAILYHFGVLTSSIHMAWVRTVGGRMEVDYRYSKNIVYNNFIWVEPTDKQKQAIEATAQAILDIRATLPDSSFAELYDEVTMPYELRQAHRANDKAVAAAYGLEDILDDEPAIAVALLRLYSDNYYS